jgi:AcrR family transcriptional regulator
MAAAAELTARERIVDAAGHLLRTRGFAAAGLRDIVEAADAPWGSLQHYFPGGKNQIAVEAIKAGEIRVGGFIDMAFERSATSAEALEWFFARTLELMVESDYEFGCPVATVALERAVLKDEVADACAAALGYWTARFTAGFTAGGLDATPAQRLAVITLSQYEGAMLVSRVQRSPQAFETASALLQELAVAER